MKVKYIKTYQHVTLDNKLVSHFPNLQHKECTMKIIDGAGVYVELANDAIIVPFANIVELRVEPEQSKKTKDK